MLKLTTSTFWVVTLLTTWRFSFSLSKLPWLHRALLLGEMFYKLYCPSPTRKSPEATILILFGGEGYSFGRRKSLRSTKPISVGCWKKAWRLMILQRCTPSVHAAICAYPTAQLIEKNGPTEKKMWVAASWYSFTKLWLHLVPYLYTLIVFCFWGLLVKLGRLTSWILLLLVWPQERCPATNFLLCILICLLERSNLELIENSS
jgi:hypothetical protein